MILYHGSNGDIGNIDLTRGLQYKDFGKGFYVTPSQTTAIRMAQKKARLWRSSPIDELSRGHLSTRRGRTTSTGQIP